MSGEFMRDEMIEARRPPDARRGIWRWFHRNLFNGPINSVVTVVTIGLLAWGLWPFVQWALIQADWIGDSRQACSGEGACWVFISARFESIIYGFYPEAARWRVDIVFALMAGLLAWLAIPRVPGKRWAAVIAVIGFPIAAYVLLLGGHFGLMYVPTREWGGLMLTLTVATIGIVGSLPIGIVLALGRRSNLPFVRAVSVVFIEFWRGVPLITVLFMASVMLPLFVPTQV